MTDGFPLPARPPARSLQLAAKVRQHAKELEHKRQDKTRMGEGLWRRWGRGKGGDTGGK